MAKQTTFSNDLIALIFNATAISNIAANGSSPITNLYVSLHTASPGATGNQSTSEAAYTGYARIAVARTSGGWACSGGVVNNTALITFGQCTASAGSALTHVGIGTGSSGAGKLLYFGALSASQSMVVGIQPQFAISALTIQES